MCQRVCVSTSPVWVGADAYDSPDVRGPIDIGELARRRAATFKRRGPISEHVRANLLGVVGELAAMAHLLRTLPPAWRVEWIADAPRPLCDITISPPGGHAYGLEIKTTTKFHWNRHGRTIDLDQLKTTDADAYLWCVVAEPTERPPVHLLGWCPVGEARSAWEEVRFSGWIRPRRQEQTVEPVEPGLVGPAYTYDSDDYGVDAYEDEAAMYGWEPDPVPEPPAPEQENPHVERAADPNVGWVEGESPLRGYRRPNVICRVTATIQPVPELQKAVTRAVRPDADRL